PRLHLRLRLSAENAIGDAILHQERIANRATDKRIGLAGKRHPPFAEPAEDFRAARQYIVERQHDGLSVGPGDEGPGVWIHETIAAIDVADDTVHQNIIDAVLGRRLKHRLR